MNKDKIIKDLKERNDKLKNQYELLEIKYEHNLKELEKHKNEKALWHIKNDLKKERIDKAIKEIDYLIGNCDLTDYQGQKIKNILRGENDGGL